MDTQDEVMIIISAQDKFSVEMKKIETEARDTKKKLDKELVYKLKADVAAFDLTLKEVRAKLRQAKTTEEKRKLTLDVQDLQRQLTEAKRKLNNYLNTGDQNVSRLQAKFNDLWSTIKDVFSGSGLHALDSFLAKIPIIGGKLQAVLAIVVGIWKAFVQAWKNAQEFEDAFAGVRKTVNDSEENLKKIEWGLIGMSKTIPMAVKELWGIAELGGQLWVPTEDLLKFTDTTAKIAVSTNLASEAAANDFAIISSITQEPIQNIDRMGSTVVALGNNFETTESKIVNFATNIAGAWHLSWLTTAQIFGISTAFSSVGIEAEAGGTATQKVLLAINKAVNKGGKELQAYARIAWQSAEDFKKSWKDNAGQGFLAFVQGLQKSGQDANLILEEMGLKDVRLQKAFLSLTGAGDKLINALSMANQAREENNALQEEADKRFKTTTSQIQIQNNKWQAFSASIGKYWNMIWVPVYKGITTFFTEMLPYWFNYLFSWFKNIWVVLWNFGHNIGVAFAKIPNAMWSAVNEALWLLEKFLNKGGDSINWIINQIKKIPGAESLIWDFKVWKASFGRVNWGNSWSKYWEYIDPLQWVQDFWSFSDYKNKRYEIAAWKVKDGIKKDLQAEFNMLEDIENILDDKKSWSAKSKTEAMKKELDKQRDIEIKAVQESLLDEEEKMKRLTEIKNKYDKKKIELEGKTDDELLKEAEDYMKELKKKREDNYKDHKKKSDDAIKDVKKYTENLDKIKKKFEEIKEKAGDTLRDIKHNMWELDKNHIKDLWARYYDVKKQIRDNEKNESWLKRIWENMNLQTLESWRDAGQKEINNIDIDKAIEHLKFKEELLFLEQKTTKEQQEQAKIEAEKSESVKLVEKHDKEKATLQEKQNITEAFSSSESIDWQKKLKIDGDKVEYRDKNKEDFVEITDFKNQEYARDLINQQLKLETEYKAEEKHLNDSKDLAINHSKEILKIWQNDTDLYKNELKEREDATRAYVENVKAMMADINQAKTASNATVNNNQVTNSNNRTTNYNITNIAPKSSSFSGVGLK